MSTSEPTWWLFHDQITYGPFSHAYIVQALARGEFHLEVRACQVGTNEWKTLRAFQLWSPREQTAPDSFHVDVSRPRASQRRLPVIAMWVAYYAIYCIPALWFLSNASCLATGSAYVETSPYFNVEILLHLVNFPIDLAFVVVCVIGGVQLRQVRKSGRTLLLIGFGAQLVWGMLMLFTDFLLYTAAASDPQIQHIVPASDGDMSNQAALFAIAALLLLPVVLGAIVFEVYAFFWLLLKGDAMYLK